MGNRIPPAKRARRPNPRTDRNIENHIDDILNFESFGHKQNNYKKEKYKQQNENSNFQPKIKIIPRNQAQENYLDALNDETYSIVFAMGPAGTGKTMLTTQHAIKELSAGRYKKIIITRPAVSVDEQHGFLPGSLIEKMAPWVIPIMDVFKEVYPIPVLEKMIQNEVIEIAPLAYMRGRTLKNAFVIFDEAQNATPSQMKMVLTRIGDNSRMCITGDLNQYDRGFELNGLKDFIERLKKNVTNSITVCEFTANDVERHPVIEEVLKLYKD